MKAILIDAVKREVREVEYNGTLENIYDLVGCDIVEAPRVEDNGDAVYVDEEGLLKPQQNFFVYDGYPQPLAGNGLLLGVNGRGESISPKTSIETVRRKVKFMNLGEVREWAATHDC